MLISVYFTMLSTELFLVGKQKDGEILVVVEMVMMLWIGDDGALDVCLYTESVSDIGVIVVLLLIAGTF